MSSAYAETQRPELLRLAKVRGLSGAGTNEDIIGRLELWDAEQADPLGLDGPSDQTPSKEAPVTQADPGPAGSDTLPSGRQMVRMPSDLTAYPKTGRIPGNRFRVEFALGERPIDDELHRHFMKEAHFRAREAGEETRGGETVAHRVGYSNDNGRRTVIYEVMVRREVAGA